jgi:aspartyl-tRNA(Asn)/glutamyl-tRNA(Gln) amidotransferase subunit A
VSDALRWATAVDVAERVGRGELSAEEATRGALDRIERASALNAFLCVDADAALVSARAIDRRRAAGEALGPLAGVPVALKDNLVTRGVPTTCASRILEGFRSPYDAHVVERLRAADAVIVGKTNMDEFAMGSSNESSAFGVVRNPWAADRAPGGSSGGSAAAVAAGLVPLAFGSDTGGSVRQPGSFCGITALKPSYGRVSRHGLVAFASSLDQVGPLARSTRDAARALAVIAGRDPRDATSVDRPAGAYEEACHADPRGARLGVAREMLEGADPDVVLAFESAVATLEEIGCTVVDVSLPHARYAVSVYYLVANAEASSNLARYDGVRYGLRVEAGDLETTYSRTRARGFGPEVKRRIMLGTYALSAGYYDAFYLKAQKVRTLIRRDYDAAFAKCDVVLTPTAPTPAFRLGERVDDPLSMYLADVYTIPASLAGVPAISTPCGLSGGGLPIGLQITAPAFEEARLFTLASSYQRATRLDERHPEVV